MATIKESAKGITMKREYIKFLEVKAAYYNDPENVVVQFQPPSTVDWISVTVEPDWKSFESKDVRFRIKPRTIMIGDIEVPEPLRVAPPVGTVYYYPTLYRLTGIVAAYSWDNLEFDKAVLSRGVMHLTKEAAEIHAKALIKISGGTV